MALSHSVARGVFVGLFRRTSRFEVTRKATTLAPGAAGTGPSASRDAVREERLLAWALLACGVSLVVATGGVDRTLAAWLVVLAMQAMPYVMALLCDRIGRARPLRPHPLPSPVSAAGD
jgi:hypothetical protein